MSKDNFRGDDVLSDDLASVGYVTLQAAQTRNHSDVFYAAVQMSQLSMVLVDPHQSDYPLVFCNQAFCQLTGYEEDEVFGRNCRFLQGPRTDPATVAVLRTALAAGTNAHVELWNYRKDGSTFWNSMFMSPVFDAENRLLYVFGSQLDATARREAEQAKGRAERMDTLGGMAAGIAHEFNNLMTVVVGNIERASVEPLTARQVERLGRADWAARAAGRLTQQLLSFAGRQTLQAEIVNLNDVVDRLGSVLAEVAAVNVPMRIDLAADPLFAEVDVGQLELALINLVRNASDAIPHEGQIKLTTRGLAAGSRGNPLENCPAVEIAVNDTGTGMPREVAARVTEPFFTTKELGKGTGLGLSMVHGFVQQSGGAMPIETEDGHGTTVRLIFPRSTNCPNRINPEP
jgi:PAS domain S-box-containing protein